MTYIIAAFLTIGVLEAVHHVPGLEAVNSFGFDLFGFQLLLLLVGLAAFLILTLLSYRSACRNFERIDL